MAKPAGVLLIVLAAASMARGVPIDVGTIDAGTLNQILNSPNKPEDREQLLAALSASTGEPRMRAIKLIGRQEFFNIRTSDSSKVYMEQYLANSSDSSKPITMFILDLVAETKNITTQYTSLPDVVGEKLSDGDIEIRRAAARAAATVAHSWREQYVSTSFSGLGARVGVAIASETDPTTKVLLIQSMGGFASNPDSDRLLMGLLRDAAPEVRKQACIAIEKQIKGRRFRPPPDFPEIAGRAANDSDPAVATAGKSLFASVYPGQEIPVYYSQDAKLMMLVIGGSSFFVIVGGIVAFAIMRARKKARAEANSSPEAPASGANG